MVPVTFFRADFDILVSTLLRAHRSESDSSDKFPIDKYIKLN